MEIQYREWHAAIPDRKSRRRYKQTHPEPELLSHMHMVCQSFRPFPQARAALVTQSVGSILNGLKGSYGLISGASALIAFIGDMDDPHVQAKVGYCGEGVILEATTMGLNTCWVAGSFRRKAVSSIVGIAKNERVIAVSPIVHALDNYTLGEKILPAIVRARKRKPLSELTNGLDEAEVFSFVGGLIEQNNDYAEKLEHLDALTRLGESTVVEAEREAERIRLQAHEIASEEARSVVAEVEEKAKLEAERIIAESEQLAQEMLKSAEETARAQADKIIADAEANIQARLAVVEQLAQDIIQGVETEAKRKAKEVKAKARKEAQVSKRAAQQLLDRSKKLAQNDIREKFEGVYQELISVLDTEGADKLNLSEIES